MVTIQTLDQKIDHFLEKTTPVKLCHDQSFMLIFKCFFSIYFMNFMGAAILALSPLELNKFHTVVFVLSTSESLYIRHILKYSYIEKQRHFLKYSYIEKQQIKCDKRCTKSKWNKNGGMKYIQIGLAAPCQDVGAQDIQKKILKTH